jgi:protein O-mannosyl-transferase
MSINIANRTFRQRWVLCFFAIMAILIYFPILNNSFISDDYDSLYRIVIEKRIIFKEFLRPLIDISFYFNYLLSGLNPWTYYLFNLVIHVLAAFMVYKVAALLPFFDNANNIFFSFTAGFLFLIYPFHSESVIWLTGRLSSMAALCAFAAIYFFFKSSFKKRNVYLAGMFFFVGLLAYESIILLPFILAVFAFFLINPRPQIRFSLIYMFAILSIYLIIRYVLSGNITSGYGDRIFAAPDISEYLVRCVKTAGRCFLPPIENPKYMLLASAITTVVFIAVNIGCWMKIKKNKAQIRSYSCLIIAFALSLFVPAAFGISTRTNEGDRLLYFPSAFFCVLISYLLFSAGSRIVLNKVVIITLAICFTFFNIKAVQTWEKASNASYAIINTCKENPTKRIVFINVPDELEGAFVFRNGFNKALVLNKIDTSSVMVSGYMNRLAYLACSSIISIDKYTDKWFFCPSTEVYKKDDFFSIYNIKTRSLHRIDRHSGLLFYWDKEKLNNVTLK